MIRLFFIRYFIGLLALLGAMIETYLGENFLLLVVAGTLWAVVYSKLQADVVCLKKSGAIKRKEVPHSTNTAGFSGMACFFFPPLSSSALMIISRPSSFSMKSFASLSAFSSSMRFTS